MNRSWFSIKNLSDDSAEISIYDEIGLWGITAKDFAEQIKAVGDRKIVLRINSPGGSVFDGAAIYNRLRDHKPGVEVKIDGLAASMASGIAMAGAPVTMAENALLMIHNPSGLVLGEAGDMRETADLLDKIKSSLLTAYTRKSGKTPEDVSDLMDAETWFTATEALEAGFIDAISEPQQIAAKFSGSVIAKFTKAPETITEEAPGAEVPTAELPAEDEVVNRLTAMNTELVTLRAANVTLTTELAARDALIVAKDAANASLTNAVADRDGFTPVFQAASQHLQV